MEPLVPSTETEYAVSVPFFATVTSCVAGLDPDPYSYLFARAFPAPPRRGQRRGHRQAELLVGVLDSGPAQLGSWSAFGS